ncbi:hypothetical protein [Rhizobium sp. LCM 4573]|uniref:hypothetical protein n=1 Tax=Rhizobium sp. LCM 4573 TaxID=1848291 RepID=UPI0008D9F844|nr:hypothetical protein [Rhizobium sp. LCM 4573]OHV84146.1 hypothetical protein LCM4573_00070 [Rhizobium sp. LCM 4573]
MALLSDYTSGTISVAADGTAVTGVGTGWVAAGFREGDLLFADGYTGVVKSVESNTALTLDQPWRGGALSGAAYRLRYQSDGSRFSAQSRALIEMIGGSGNLEALGGLESAPNTLPYFTGAGQMGLTAFDQEARDFLAAATEEERLQALGFSAFMAGLRDDADEAALLTSLGFSDFMAGLRDRVDGPALYGAMGQIPNAQIRNDLTADKAFRRGNILGTASQTAGVPTGALVERGSNANGEYVRYADGTQICISPALNPSTSIATGSFFRSFPIVQGFPAAFVAPPACFGNTAEEQTWVNARQDFANSRWAAVVWASYAGGSFIRLGAIGRWF